VHAPEISEDSPIRHTTEFDPQANIHQREHGMQDHRNCKCSSQTIPVLQDQKTEVVFRSLHKMFALVWHTEEFSVYREATLGGYQP
jgi:hypothetical protein